MTKTYANVSDGTNFTYKSLKNDNNERYSLPNHGNYQNIKSTDLDNTRETTKLIQKKEMERGTTINNNIEKDNEDSREATAVRKAFVLVACLFLHFIAGGTSVALGVIYVDLIRVFDSPHSQAALVQSIFMGTMIGGGVFFTGVLQKKGTGLPVMIASSIAGIAFLASSFAPNVPTLIALVGAVGGLSMSVYYLSGFVTVGWIFRENRKTALALLTFGWTFGQILFPYISQFLVSFFQWNGSFVLISGFILNGIPCGLIMYTSRQFFLIIKPPATTLKDTLSDCLQDYLFVFFLFAAFCFSSLSSVEMWFIPDLTVVRGFDRSIGAVLLSLLGIFGFIGRIIGTIFLKIFKRIESLVHAFYAIMLWGVAHFLLGYFHELWGLALGVLMRGLSAGITMAVMPGSQIELRGIERYPQTVAICNMISGVASMLGGLLGGVTVDLTGGYEFIFTLAAVVFLVCGVFMIIVWLLSKRKKRRVVSAVIEYKIVEENQKEKEPLLSRQDHCSRHELTV